MAYAIVVFVFAVAIIVARVYFNMRKVKQANSSESWDEKVIAGLRQRGYAPFNPYPVDFFLALPFAFVGTDRFLFIFLVDLDFRALADFFGLRADDFLAMVDTLRRGWMGRNRCLRGAS